MREHPLLTKEELAALLEDDAAGKAGLPDTDVSAPADHSCKSLLIAVHALTAKVDYLEGLVRDLRLQALHTDSADGRGGTAADEHAGRLAPLPIAEAGDKAGPGEASRLSRLERFGRRNRTV